VVDMIQARRGPVRTKTALARGGMATSVEPTVGLF
jgi:hypothetical protein